MEEDKNLYRQNLQRQCLLQQIWLGYITEKTPLYSQCCGVEMNDFPESDLCPQCLEHTGVEEEEE